MLRFMEIIILLQAADTPTKHWPIQLHDINNDAHTDNDEQQILKPQELQREGDELIENLVAVCKSGTLTFVNLTTAVGVLDALATEVRT